MNFNTLKAIFRRDFVSYFSSPTGYVFICVFVVLSSLATFWPPEFFANNLANLDQLSRWLPFIMLVFIPAITMSMWAEERRQGTDELLLTIPASDFDVVLGKYLAGVAIFTVSLLFSALSIFMVFQYGLGSPDPGLFFSTYVGYWFIGIAMIAIGMVASFLTSNLTVGFILGTLFNLPLALFGVADWFIKDPALAQKVRQWSALEQFHDFERGVISIGGISYFVLLAAVMLYICMVLIGRRHWQSREDEQSLLGHYLIRGLSLLAIAFGVTAVLQEKNWLRADVSSAQLSSLSGDTIKLIRDLRDDPEVRPIKIDAYVSPQVPTEYAGTKLNLLSTLEELKALGGGKIQVVKHEIENYGAEAELAEKNYGITPQQQLVGEGAQMDTAEFMMGVAFRSGPDKVVVPFINKGIPVEYELVRSIMTVAQKERLRLGVVDTGIPIMDPSLSSRRDWAVISELRKQYELTLVDPAQPISTEFDALFVMQPSMLGPDPMDNLIDAVKAGVPTALFEDPLPFVFPTQMVPGTDQPKMNPMMGQMGMFGGGGMEPKGNIQELWELLGVEFNGSQVVFQDYNPDVSVRTIWDEQWVFIDDGNGAAEPFNSENPISSGLNRILLLYPGSVRQAIDSDSKFSALAVTGAKNSGTLATQQLARAEQGEMGRVNRDVFDRRDTSDSYIVAAEVTRLAPLDELLDEGGDEIDPADDPEAIAKRKEAEANRPTMNAVIVADIDCLIDGFFAIRERGDEAFLPGTQNVTFALNIVDQLAGDDRFLAIRKRAREHSTLTKIDEATADYRAKAAKEEEDAIAAVEEKIDAAQKQFEEQMAAIDERTDLSAMNREILRRRTEIDAQRKLQRDLAAYGRERSRTVKRIDYELEQNVATVENKYKMIALLLPPIPPLLLAVWVFFRRREAEQQGVARERLR
ncbi:MAG: ABC transporter permease [Planctomycetaceae bacterium]|nr:ABC transporter permease [Planctomycetaceae bacterium]